MSMSLHRITSSQGMDKTSRLYGFSYSFWEPVEKEDEVLVKKGRNGLCFFPQRENLANANVEEEGWISGNCESLKESEISHASKVMLKILQAVSTVHDQRTSRCQAGFRKGRGTRDQIANIRWHHRKSNRILENIYFCFIDYAKAFDYVDHNKLWKILQEMGIPDHLTCLLGNLYAGQEATVRTGHRTTNWIKIGKGVC